nr:MAG TPA: hypothetical protein [Caudoviricetes sp.]
MRSGTWSARHPPPGGAVQQSERGGRRQNYWRLAAASLFGLSPDSQ